MNYLFGILDDNTPLTIVSWFIHQDFYTTSEPLFKNIYIFFGTTFNSFIVYNFYILLTFVLNFIFVYKFFSFFSNSKISKILVSLIFCFSPYFLYKSQVHINLIPLWTLLIYINYQINLYLKNNYTPKTFIFSGLLLSFTILYSNYLGYMGIVFAFFYYIYIYFENNFLSLRDFLIRILIFCLTVFSILLIFNFNYLKVNYLSFINNNTQKEKDTYLLKRGVDEFLLFSAKPYMYFTPPIFNPFFNPFTEVFLKINFLHPRSSDELILNTYIPNEHSTVYLGWVNIVFGFLGYKLLSKKQSLDLNRKDVYRFVIYILIIFFIFSLPPYFSFFNIKYYLPSYLSYLAFPMFRSTARLSILVLLFLLVFVLRFYEQLFSKYQFTKYKKVLIYLAFTFTLMESFTIINFTKVDKIPDLLKFASNNLEKESIYFTYPYSKSNTTFFWSKDFQGRMFDYHYYARTLYQTENYPIYAEDIIKNCNNFSKIENLDYIVFYENIASEKSQQFFDKYFEVVYDSKKSNEPYIFNYFLFQIIDQSDNLSNNGKIYKFNKNVDCNK